MRKTIINSVFNYTFISTMLIFMLCSCSEYQRQQGCTLDKLHIHGNVVKIETIMQSTIPYTEMLAESLDPKYCISTLCGNVTLDFNNQGNLKEYTGYNMYGKVLFDTEDFNYLDKMTLKPSILPVENTQSTEYHQKATFDKDSNIIRITKIYDGMEIILDKDTKIEFSDTTYYEYLHYDKHHNWTEARVINKSLYSKYDDTYKIKRQITYDGESTPTPLIEQLSDYNRENHITAKKYSYHKVLLSDYGSIEIPEFMVSDEANKETAEAASPQGSISYLYSFAHRNKDIYSTLSISTSPNSQLDFDSLTDDEMQYNDNDNEALLAQLTNILAKGGTHILLWLPYQFKRINGKTALVIRYYRYGKSSCIPVYVEIYTFCVNSNETLSITYSLQSNLFNQLQQPLRHAVQTIQVN